MVAAKPQELAVADARHVVVVWNLRRLPPAATCGRLGQRRKSLAAAWPVHRRDSPGAGLFGDPAMEATTTRAQLGCCRTFVSGLRRRSLFPLPTIDAGVDWNL